MIEELIGARVSPVVSRMRDLRLRLKDRFGDEYSVRACAQRAGLSERSWGSYERGEAMPPADAAVAIARVLGLTVEQLEFRRVEQGGSGADSAADHDEAQPGR